MAKWTIFEDQLWEHEVRVQEVHGSEIRRARDGSSTPRRRSSETWKESVTYIQPSESLRATAAQAGRGVVMDETEGELCSLVRARSAARHMTHSVKNRPLLLE